MSVNGSNLNTSGMMEHVPRDIEQWLAAKLEDPWSSEKISSLLTKDLLSLVATRFPTLDPSIKLKLLFSFLSLRKKTYQELQSSIANIISLGTKDDDEWVRVISPLLSELDNDTIDPEILSAMGVEGIKETVSRLSENLRKDHTPSFYPLECQYLNSSLFSYTQPQNTHFKLKKTDNPLGMSSSSSSLRRSSVLSTSLNSSTGISPLKPSDAPMPLRSSLSSPISPRGSSSSIFSPKPQYNLNSSLTSLGSGRSFLQKGTPKMQVIPITEVRELADQKMKKPKFSSPVVSTTFSAPAVQPTPFSVDGEQNEAEKEKEKKDPIKEQKKIEKEEKKRKKEEETEAKKKASDDKKIEKELKKAEKAAEKERLAAERSAKKKRVTVTTLNAPTTQNATTTQNAETTATSTQSTNQTTTAKSPNNNINAQATPSTQTTNNNNNNNNNPLSSVLNSPSINFATPTSTSSVPSIFNTTISPTMLQQMNQLYGMNNLNMMNINNINSMGINNLNNMNLNTFGILGGGVLNVASQLSQVLQPTMFNPASLVNTFSQPLTNNLQPVTNNLQPLPLQPNPNRQLNLNTSQQSVTTTATTTTTNSVQDATKTPNLPTTIQNANQNNTPSQSFVPTTTTIPIIPTQNINVPQPSTVQQLPTITSQQPTGTPLPATTTTTPQSTLQSMSLSNVINQNTTPSISNILNPTTDTNVQQPSSIQQQQQPQPTMTPQQTTNTLPPATSTTTTTNLVQDATKTPQVDANQATQASSLNVPNPASIMATILESGANMLSEENRRIIEAFLAGDKTNPEQGVKQIQLHVEQKAGENGASVVEMSVFEINYDQGKWRKFKKRRNVPANK